MLMAVIFLWGMYCMSDKLRVAAYCRVSTDKDDQANSLSSQRQYFTDYINNREGWRLVNIYYDEGVSGTSIKKRAEFNRMMQDASLGKIDRILTKEVSRFARNTVDTLSHTRKLKEMGVGVLFMSDNIDTMDKDGELRLTIMASIAQEESRKTSERVKWGQKRQMEKGVVFGRDMLGYTVNGGKLSVNHDEAEVVKLIYHKFLNEDKGTHVIARELREAGIRPKRVKHWSNVVILRVLRNEKYVGDLLQKKTFTPDYLSHAKKYNRGNEDMVYLKDHHEPIIDRETWDKVQKELARRAPSEEQKSKHSNRYWCSGKLICGECGQRFVSRTKKLRGGEQYKAWRCYAAATHGLAKKDVQGNDIGCNSHSINDKVLLRCAKYVVAHIHANKEKIIKELSRDIKAILSDVKVIDTAKLQAKIEELNGKKTKAINLNIEGTISKADLMMMNEQYNTEIAELQQRIFEAENQNAIQQLQVESINAYISEIRDMVDLKTDDELLYRELIEKMIIRNENIVDVYLNCVPFGIRLHYSAEGKMEKYSVDITRMEILDNQE
jgi:DNA invertase Pin-like site-specific DNA recombinase/uncharacterized coiled-coil protein SlyX